MRLISRVAIVSAVGLLLWQAANFAFGTGEPWDSPNYWIVYLIAIGLSALFGYRFNRPAWLWGLLMIFSQLSVMWWSSEPGPLLAVGLLFLAALSLPAIGVSVTATRLRQRGKR